MIHSRWGLDLEVEVVEGAIRIRLAVLAGVRNFHRVCCSSQSAKGAIRLHQLVARLEHDEILVHIP